MSSSDNNALNSLKKKVFYDLLNMTGRVFIVVRYSENVSVGNRGFLTEEKKNGLVLVFNSRMNFSWEEEVIQATLVFGTSPEKCFIPADDIVAIYSPEAQAQFMVSPQQKRGSEKSLKKEKPEKTEEKDSAEKVVKVDFKKKK